MLAVNFAAPNSLQVQVGVASQRPVTAYFQKAEITCDDITIQTNHRSTKSHYLRFYHQLSHGQYRTHYFSLRPEAGLTVKASAAQKNIDQNRSEKTAANKERRKKAASKKKQRQKNDAAAAVLGDTTNTASAAAIADLKGVFLD
ncbi:hypothetical protein B0H15DRAFT_954680 [Mycena belliarum]|uniref:Uncharacterized protein n=1 Tax=Mycena belliarum TaxID=1033014 RepID=A0AAD6TWT2_9AGAR|nr:hypothetical protein B0H15DRAFT_954680 [Mycena belliae]